MKWSLVPLGEVCLPVQKVDPVESGRSSVRYVDIGSLGGPTRALSEAESVSSASAPSRCRQVIRSGDTLFSTVRPNLMKIAHVEPQLDGEFASTGFAVLRPGPEIEARFLYYFAISNWMLDQILPLQRGVSYPAVLDKHVRAATIPLPHRSEQRRIVSILDDHLSRLDAAECSVSDVRRRLGGLRRSALEWYFAGSPLVPLAELLEDVSAGKSFGASNAPAREDEWGIVKVSAMTWGQFRPEENKAVPDARVDPRFEIREGDLLVSRANTSDYVGASVLVGPVRPRLLLSDKSLRLTPRSGISAEWLWRVLQTPSVRRQISALATGTKDSMRNISQASLLRVQVPLRSSTEQAVSLDEFEAVNSQLEQLDTATQMAAERSERLRDSLLGAAFSGRLTSSHRHDDLEIA